MLEFNPAKRITAEAALRDEYFDDVRLEEQEEGATVDFDKLLFDQVETTLEEIKTLLLAEMKSSIKELK